MRSFIVDKYSYEDYLNHLSSGVCVYTLSHNKYLSEYSNIVLNKNSSKLYAVPNQHINIIKQILARKGQSNRITVLKR